MTAKETAYADSKIEEAMSRLAYAVDTDTVNAVFYTMIELLEEAFDAGYEAGYTQAEADALTEGN